MRLRARLVGLVASVLLIGVVVAVPTALVQVGVDLIPSELPTLGEVWSALRSPDDGTLVLQVVTFVAWLAWAVLSVSIVLEVVARLRGVRAPRIPGLHLPQLGARQLVSAAALLFVALPSVGMTGAGGASAHAAVAHDAVDEPVMVQAGEPVLFQASEANLGPASGVAPPTYTVQPGDSLSAIARDQLGDADRWPELVDLNPIVADDPDLIYAGTVLRLPASVVPAEAAMTTDTYVVQPGDTLSSIAAHELGDAERYPEIFEASKNTVQPDGRQVTDPDVIDVGQVLTIPGKVVPVAATVDPVPVGATLEPETEPAPTGVAPVPSQVPPSTYPAPEPIPAGAAQVDAPERDDEEPSTAAPWLLAGLTGGGAVLAGSLFLLRARRRHAQARARRPGRTLPAPDVVLAPVEKTISAVGAVTAPTVEHMDAVLRRLAASVTRDGLNMPDLAAVELTANHLVLHLGTPTTLGAPWLGSSDGYRWRVPATVPLDEVGPDVTDQPAPYPLLATVGFGDDEAVWLLNVEGLDVSITGDPTYGLDFARYIVAEVACNPWSAGARVECIGVAHELAALNPDRVRVHEGPADGGDDPVDDALAEAVRTLDNAAAVGVGVDVVTARATQAGAEAWTAQLILLDASTSRPALDELLDLVHANPGRTGTCVVLNGTRPDAPGIVLDISAEGRLTLASAGLDLVAVGLTSDEAQGCAALLAQSERVDAVAVPVDEEATQGWWSFVDQSGALRDEHTLPREPLPDPDRGDTGPAVSAASSVLSEPDELYLEAAATTSEDLQTLAPRVAATVRRDVEDADPRLGEDVAAWFSDSSRLPKLRLLGPVRATTRGKPLLKRKPYMTELLTFIALHPHGATPGEVSDAFGITPAKVREYVRLVREWLGTNPRTGEPHLPDARLAPGSLHRGTAVYEAVDLLVDLDLFRRLRARGQARGADGIEDLRIALRLVEGRPFDAPVQRRAGGGWAWLVDGDRLDEHAVVAVVDVAHLVVTHALAAGDLAVARMAAETAAMAAPFEEIPRLDLAAVATAEGRHAEARRIVRDEIANRSDDDGAPPELAGRTEEIIQRRTEWAGSRAS